MATTTTAQVKQPKALNISLWFAQVILAGMFLFSAQMKLSPSVEGFLAVIPSEFLIRFIGVSELLGAIGLILPSALRIKPELTAWAAIGLALVMLLATLFHIFRAEISGTAVTVLLGALAAFVAWGRLGKGRIYPKS